MKVIDLFSGCGGMSLGFEMAGHEIVLAIDSWEPAVRTYQANFSHPVYSMDIGSAEGGVVAICNSFAPGIIVGGPPCQDFSSSGKRVEAGKASLTVSFARVVAGVLPTIFVMENVERALRSAAYAEAKGILAGAGYSLVETVLDASLCGVPQKRKRLFLVGTLGYADEGLEGRLSAPSGTPMTVRDYFGDSLGLQCYYRHPRSYKRRGVFSIDEPSPTIRGVNRPVPPNYTSHPGDACPVTPDLRPLTTRERASIQTFPSTFEFSGAKTVVEQMVGNAVPVNLARHVGEAIAGN